MSWTIHSEVVHPDIETLKILMRKTKDKRMFERYQTVFLHLQGMTYVQIVVIVGRAMVTVGNYVKAHRENGIEGLNMGQSSGRPAFLTNDQEEQLRKLVTEQRPADVGFPSEMNWTSFLIREWIERTYGVVYTDRGVRKLLHHLDFSYTKQDFEEVKKIKRVIDHILFQDESTIRDYQALANTWFPKGQQKKSLRLANKCKALYPRLTKHI